MILLVLVVLAVVLVVLEVLLGLLETQKTHKARPYRDPLALAPLAASSPYVSCRVRILNKVLLWTHGVLKYGLAMDPWCP